MNNELRDVLKAQRWRRRRNFWAGFAVIALVGGLWAQLSKDPFGPNFDQGFQDGFVNDFPAEPAFEQLEPVPQTTIALPPAPLTTPPQFETTIAVTVPPTTVAP